MSEESNELIREVTSSLRNDKIKEFYIKNSKKIIIGLVVILLVIAVVVGKNIYLNKKNEKYSINIQNSITSQQVGKISESKEDLEKVFFDKSAPENLKAIAGFRLAAVYLTDKSEDNSQKVLSIYEEISKCKSCDPYSSDLAGMLWVKFIITNNKDGSYEELVKKIEEIEKSSKHYKYEIAIDRAFYELSKDHLKKSQEIFESVANSLEATQSVKDVAKQGLRIVQQKSAK